MTVARGLLFLALVAATNASSEVKTAEAASKKTSTVEQQATAASAQTQVQLRRDAALLQRQVAASQMKFRASHQAGLSAQQKLAAQQRQQQQQRMAVYQQQQAYMAQQMEAQAEMQAEMRAAQEQGQGMPFGAMAAPMNMWGGMGGVGMLGGFGGSGMYGMYGGIGAMQPMSPLSFGFGHTAGPSQMRIGPSLMGGGGPSIGMPYPFAFPAAPFGAGGQGYPYSGFGMMNPYMQGFGDEPPAIAPEAGAAAR